MWPNGRGIKCISQKGLLVERNRVHLGLENTSNTYKLCTFDLIVVTWDRVVLLFQNGQKLENGWLWSETAEIWTPRYY